MEEEKSAGGVTMVAGGVVLMRRASVCPGSPVRAPGWWTPGSKCYIVILSYCHNVRENISLKYYLLFQPALSSCTGSTWDTREGRTVRDVTMTSTV